MRAFIGSLLFVFVVLPLLCSLFFLVSINSWVFDRGFYQEILDNPAVYDEIIDETVIEISGTGTVFDELPPEAVGAGLREILTPEYLRTQTTQVIDQVFNVLEGNSDSINIAVDVTPIKEALAGTQGANFAAAIVAALPQCRAGENPRNNAAEFPTCRAEGVSDEQLIQQIAAALPALTADIPDTLRVDETVDFRDQVNLPADFPSVSSFITTALLSLAALALLLWFANALLLGDGRRGRLSALGVTLLIPAAFVLFVGVAMSGNLWESAIRSSFENGNPGPYTEVLTDSAIESVSRVRTGFLVAGGIPFAIGIGLLVWGLASPSDKRKRDEDDGLYVSVPNRTI